MNKKNCVATEGKVLHIKLATAILEWIAPTSFKASGDDKTIKKIWGVYK